MEKDPNPIQDWYIDWANTLDSAGKDSAPARDRILQRSTVNYMMDTMMTAIKSARHIDCIKKHVFYGRSLDVFDDYSVTEQTVNGIGTRLDNHNTVMLIHAVFGLFDEAGELMQALFEHIFLGKPLDPINLKEEFGDSLWYLAIAAKYFDQGTFTFFMLGNYHKLVARYPEGSWRQSRALERDLEAEHEALMSKKGRASKKEDNAGGTT